MESTNIYNEVMHSERDLREIFKEISLIGTTEEFEKLFESFHERLGREFQTVIYNITETTHQDKYDMPEKLFKRMGAATTMIHLMGLGRQYDEELYHETVQFLSNVKRDKPLN